MPNRLKPQDFIPGSAAAARSSVDHVKYHALLNAAADAIISITPRGAIVDFNPAAELTFQYRADELIGKNISQLMPDLVRDRHDEYLQRFASLGNSQVIGSRREIEARRRDGSTFPAELSVAEVHVGDEHFFTGILHDISDRKSYERLLAEAATNLSRLADEAKVLQFRAEAASRAKSEILTNTSHELRTPLAAILGFAEIIGEESRTDEIREFARLIQKSGQHLLQIVNDILDFASIEAGASAVTSEVFAPREIVHDVLNAFAPQARAHNCRLNQLTGSEVPASIVSDPLRFRQILTNLVSNAVKYTSDGEVVVRMAVDPVPDPAELLIEVVDTGIGIPADKITELFLPFSVVDHSLTRSHGGTGLGLAICKRLCRLLGGNVAVQSTFGKGSTFFVRLPLISSEDSGGPIASNADARKSHDIQGLLPGRRLLVVDDSPANVQFLVQGLAKTGANLETAENGQLAVNRVKSSMSADRPFDAILLDLQMPVMDGFTAAAEIRDLGFRGPIIAVTAEARHVVRVRAMAAGCNDLLIKPVNRRDVVQCVLDHLGMQPGEYEELL